MPRDLFILGCGRSGTSMVAGLFQCAGYFQGTKIHPARESNPRGFFEDAGVNSINEALLQPLVPNREAHGAIEYLADSPMQHQRWLSRIPLNREISVADNEALRIRKTVQNRPFCLKDPRFCYTLHLWRGESPGARMICVFRHPQVVVSSILKEISVMPYLANLALSVREAFEVWRLMYSHVLRRHSLTGQWLFVEYDDLFSSSALDRIAEFSEASIDRTFPDRKLHRSGAISTIDSGAIELYNELILKSKATIGR